MYYTLLVSANGKPQDKVLEPGIGQIRNITALKNYTHIIMLNKMDVGSKQ